LHQINHIKYGKAAPPGNYTTFTAGRKQNVFYKTMANILSHCGFSGIAAGIANSQQVQINVVAAENQWIIYRHPAKEKSPSQ
jgi:hypothetical protein